MAWGSWCPSRTWQQNVRVRWLPKLIPNLHLAQAQGVQVQTSVTARAKRRLLQLPLKEMYLSSCSLYLQNCVRQQLKNQIRGQEAEQKWSGALFCSVPRSRWVAVCNGGGNAESTSRWLLGGRRRKQMRGGRKRDEGNFCSCLLE